MTLMPHSIFEHYIEQRFQVNFRRIRVPAYLICPAERTSRERLSGPMSGGGQSHHSEGGPMTFGLLRQADIFRAGREFAKVP